MALGHVLFFFHQQTRVCPMLCAWLRARTNANGPIVSARTFKRMRACAQGGQWERARGNGLAPPPPATTMANVFPPVDQFPNDRSVGLIK